MHYQLPAVTANTLQGKILVRLLRMLLCILDMMFGKRWTTPPQYFHDDPRHYNIKDLLFFAYKYYYKSPLKDDAEGFVSDFFKRYPPNFGIPEGFDVRESITLTAAGDLMPYEWIQPHYCQHLWDDIATDFFDADIRFANLETPIDTSHSVSLVPEVMLNDMYFNADETMFNLFNPASAPPLSRDEEYGFSQIDKHKWGFDILSTANNHSLDRGEEGVKNTMAFLQQKNIACTGTALTEHDRWHFPVIERNGIRVAFVAYTFSMNKMVNPTGKPYLVNHLEVNQPNIDLMTLKKDILFAKTVRKADIVVLSLHFSNAYQSYPCKHIVENTKQIFEECGPDIILGGHAHNIQPMATYPFKCPLSGENKKGFVIFSLGDFIAYDIFNWCHLPVYLKLTLSKGVDYKKNAIKTILTDVKVTPVYTCGTYKSKTKRELRLLRAEVIESQIKQGNIPHFMSRWHIKELTGLMSFYRDIFAQNLK